MITIPTPYKRYMYYQLPKRQLSKYSAVLHSFHLLVFSVNANTVTVVVVKYYPTFEKNGPFDA